MPNQAEIFLRENQEASKQVEKILYFQSALNLGLLSFASLQNSSGIFVVFSLLFLFFAYGFWFLSFAIESNSIQYEEAFKNVGGDAGASVDRLTDHLDSNARRSGSLLIVLVFLSIFSLFCGLLDQYTRITIFPFVPELVIVSLFALVFVILLAAWLVYYRTLSKGLDEFRVES